MSRNSRTAMELKIDETRPKTAFLDTLGRSASTLSQSGWSGIAGPRRHPAPDHRDKDIIGK
ncbi:MAG: hypothetical protein GVY13_13495 [Alphaproteobacteria bacterium]|nr:hypothetical protein [Alphaproteobacteria bacterium]